MIPSKWALAGMLAAGLVHGQSKWIRMETPHFQAYSAAGERETRVALNYFERVRAFFLKMSGREPANPVPVHIVMFRNEKEYEPYRPREFAIAYYFGGAERDYVVMGKAGEQAAQVATHEYVHLIAQHAGLNYPPWLNEGIAELFSTLKTIGDNIEFGNVIPGRLAAAQRERWVPLSVILQADANSPYYNETQKAGNLYNQSWALVHMLATTNDYRPRFDVLQRTIRDGMPSIQALETVYEKPLEKIEKELQFYIRGASFKRLVIRGEGLDVEKMELAAEPADMFDVNLALADLLTKPEQESERRERLEELARQNADRPEPHASLAYIAWRRGDFEEATGHFSDAYKRGARSPKLLRDFAMLARRDRAEEAILALSDLIQQDPSNVETRLDLAAMQYSQRQWGGVIATLASIANVKASQAPRLFQMIATAQLQLGARAEARTNAQRFREYAQTDAQRAEASRMIEYIDDFERRATLAANSRPESRASPALLTPELAELATSSPGLVRREIPPETVPNADEAAILQTILRDDEGLFVELVCSGEWATMVLETSEGRRAYVITEPNKMIVTGRPPGMVNLQCGPQEAREKLRIQYTESPAGLGGAGIVHAVHFGQ